MNADDVFYTRTMAKVLVDQGNLKKAAEIYHYLLEREPGNPDLVDALSEIETQLIEIGSDDLVRLFGRWIDLLLTHNTLEKLKKLKP
ncbi:MAG: tetratricopeptide repeat protein [Deltaproteobacteria bacterium]|nr:tetratricopeptide repeat protein [Deltaproteobacteria bacterium]MDX2496841.1 tetratricopeptide repeat protein [Desulfobacterales bacterium]MBW1968189.1 tetratricopeptide repeat protein [Deltaproteobacteria bacterium]MBW2155536.1 tetratricopeptide repeat protein [Deltaproteobacteria bacterium]MBW2226226.1 tetratricopeptide repeat protein [Deltaproteobacteria bacterium]